MGSRRRRVLAVWWISSSVGLGGLAAETAESCPAGVAPSACGNSWGIGSEELRRFFGPLRERSDGWLTAASRALEEPLPLQAAEPLRRAVAMMRRVLLPETLRDAWGEVAAAVAAAPSLRGLQAAFAWRYLLSLKAALGPRSPELAEAESAVAGDASAGVARAGLLLAREPTSLPAAAELLRAARRRPDDGAGLRLAVALHGSGQGAAALRELPREGDARALAAFAYIAATGSAAEELRGAVLSALREAQRQRGRGAALAAVYSESLHGRVPFEVCQRLFSLERALLFAPSDCESRLSLAALLRRSSAPVAAEEGSSMLQSLALECPDVASAASGMSRAWVEHFAHDLHSVADLRGGIREAARVAVDVSLQEDPERAQHAHQAALEAFKAADVAERTRAFREVPRAEPRRCALGEPPLARPARADPLGCPVVAEAGFEACLQERRPCVVRKAVAQFLGCEPSRLLERWVDAVGNTSIVHVSFPFPGMGQGLPTLNSLQRTPDFLARDDVRASLGGRDPPDPDATPWTLLRPGAWAMRLREAVAWARAHPQQVYMNQQMLMDLGSFALGDLRTPDWVSASGLRLLSALLWLASGAVATGYHYDSPENLLLQLSGSKEVILLRPSEVENLYYAKVPDVQADSRLLRNGTLEVFGVRTGVRSSSDHSMIDISRPEQAKEFPRYAQSMGASCEVSAGDVLYIPAYWHHAVVTVPDEQCVGVSLNLWHLHPRTSPTFQAEVARWREAST